MAEVKSDLIKALREKSGAGMMDCKRALSESLGDLEKAIDWLRKKGLSTASKKSDRVTAEGLVAVAVNGNSAVLVEVNSETDFVARNDQFQLFVKNLANIAFKSDGTVESLKELPYDSSKSVKEALISLISTIGENLTIRRIKKFDSDGYCCSYMHNAIEDGIGKIGVLVSFSSKPKNENLGKQIAMHIAATQPKSLDIVSLDSSLVEREKNIQRELALQSGKSKDIVEKMLDGRISKFYQEVCLLEQNFVVDPDKKISQVLRDNNTNILSYEYFILGAGIEKHIVDFAEEVAKTISK